MPNLNIILNRKLPLVTLLMAALLCATFVMFKQQDNDIWQQATDLYKQDLLADELPIYLDFIERRLNIQQIGSADYLSQLQNYSGKKDTAKLTALILSDNLFYPHLKENGRLYMPSLVFGAWQVQREEINDLVAQLSEQRFALFPFTQSSTPAPADFITHPFVESYNLRFFINLSLFVLLTGLLERYLRKSTLLLHIFLSSLSGSIFYLLFSSPYSPTFLGSSGLIYGVAGALCAVLYWHVKSIKRPKNLRKLSLTVVLLMLLLLTKSTSELVLNLIDHSIGISYLLTALLSFSVFSLAKQFNQEQIPNNSHHNSMEDWTFRTEMADVMNAIAHFKFDIARDALRGLAQRYPQSALVLEQRYHLEKLQPDDGDYWDCANKLIQLSVKKQDYPRMKRLFHDIQKNAASKQRARESLKPDSYHKMMMVFVKHDDLTKAEQAFLFLEVGGQINIIRDACSLLIQEFKVRGMTAKQQQYQMLYERLH